MSLVHQIGLTLIKNIGAVQSRRLLDYFGSAEEVFKAGEANLLKVEGIGKISARLILETDALDRAAAQLEFINKHQIEVLFITDPRYPKRLRHCYDAPIVLYFKGSVNFNATRIISVVGTRKATSYGRELCKRLIAHLVNYDVLVISGLAYGIDIVAHKECVVNGIPTVGVLGHGLDRIYPEAHRPIAKKMVANGGLLTEFLPDTIPDKENFPKRNRIIAGLCDAVIVVEASAKGGALITADIANSYSRDVYAFPGRTSDLYSEGCNFLIKTNRAALITKPEDLVYNLGWDRKVPESRNLKLALNLNSTEQAIIDYLRGGDRTIDEIGAVLKSSASKMAMVLLSMEMEGLIFSLPGNRYQIAQ